MSDADVSDPAVRAPSDADYARLLALRVALRHFAHWSAQAAKAVGLTPVHHQLLLAIRGQGDPAGPTIGQLAETLVLRHHSAVGLVDRAQCAGLVARARDPRQHSVVRVTLTERGERALESLSAMHLRHHAQIAPAMAELWRTAGAAGDASAAREPATPAGGDAPSDGSPGRGRRGDSTR